MNIKIEAVVDSNEADRIISFVFVPEKFIEENEWVVSTIHEGIKLSVAFDKKDTEMSSMFFQLNGKYEVSGKKMFKEVLRTYRELIRKTVEIASLYGRETISFEGYSFQQQKIYLALLKRYGVQYTMKTPKDYFESDDALDFVGHEIYVNINDLKTI